MNKKLLHLIVLGVAFAIFMGGLYVAAQYVVKSPNSDTITVLDYTLTLAWNSTSCRIGEAILFTGNLKLDSANVLGETVTLYFSNGTSTGLTDDTDMSGNYAIAWTATAKGSYQFYTEATIA